MAPEAPCNGFGRFGKPVGHAHPDQAGRGSSRPASATRRRLRRSRRRSGAVRERSWRSPVAARTPNGRPWCQGRRRAPIPIGVGQTRATPPSVSWSMWTAPPDEAARATGHHPGPGGPGVASASPARGLPARRLRTHPAESDFQRRRPRRARRSLRWLSRGEPHAIVPGTGLWVGPYRAMLDGTHEPCTVVVSTSATAPTTRLQRDRVVLPATRRTLEAPAATSMRCTGTYYLNGHPQP
jgi:hypothetical protein